MRTVGVDLAAAPAATAVAVIEWRHKCAQLSDLVTPADDRTVHEYASGATRVGIDSPFGWPDDFVALVTAHHRGEAYVGRGLDQIANRRPLAYRETDRRLIADDLGRPLSVSADQIAHVAFRCTGLLADLGVTDRADGWAVEAYPAGALKHWGMTSRGYKRKANRPVLAGLVEELQRRAPWLALGAHTELMALDDNAFDAVITALIARAAALGHTSRPDADVAAVAAREGWIHLPTCTLDALV